MVQSAIQTAFHSGEWSPSLYARVDLQKYHSAAALLRNFYVDYRGGASTRQGTRFIAQCNKSGMPVRLIPFQPSSGITYVLEFGDGYIRFYSNGAQIVTAPNAPYTLTSPFAASDLFPNPLTGNPGIKFVQDVTSLIICHPSYRPQILTLIAPTNWTISTINFGATIATPTISSLITNLPGAPNNWNYAYTVTAVDTNGQESTPAIPATLTGFDYLGTIANAGTNTLSWSAVTGAMSYNVYKASPVFNVAIPAGAPYGFIGNTTALSFNDAFPGIGPDFSQSPPQGQNPFQGAGVVSYTITNNGTSYTTVPSVSVAAPPAGGYPATAAASLGAVSFAVSHSGSVVTAGNDPNGAVLIFPNGVTATIVGTSLVSVSNGRWTYNVTTFTFLNAGSITGAGTLTPTNPVQATSCSVLGFIDFGGSTPSATITWALTAVNVLQSGAGYTSAPAVTFSAGTGAATANLGMLSAGNPGVPGFVQERLTFGGQANNPQSFNMSQPGSFFNFNTSNPSEADDAISGSIFSGELNDIKSLTTVPTGLLVFAGHLAWVVNGGGGLSAYNPITPSNVTASPQAFAGSNDLPPLKINQDLLYCTNRGSYVRDLSYNVYANLFSGQDISVLSSHLFFGFYLVQWTWAQEPFKTAWAVRNDGVMLSLSYVKDQELIGWSHHDTNGQFLSVCSVTETVNGNVVDAVYVIAERNINGSLLQYVERIADRFFPYGHEDAWSVDCALQTTAAVTSATTLTVANNSGQNVTIIGDAVTLTDNSGPFTNAMATNNWIVRAGGGIYKITTLLSSIQVIATVVRVPTLLNNYIATAFQVVGGYGIWQPVTSVSGLTQLANLAVTGVADGTVVSGTVSNTGTLSLGGTYTKVTIGLAFTPQLKTLPLELGNPTVQGKPKQINAVTVRVADTLGLSIGSSFSTLVAMKESQLGNQNYYLNAVVSDLIDADTRTQIDSQWTIPGQYCIQQNLPYPASILGVIPEFANTQRQA